jgi:hypothetical protein
MQYPGRAGRRRKLFRSAIWCAQPTMIRLHQRWIAFPAKEPGDYQQEPACPSQSADNIFRVGQPRRRPFPRVLALSRTHPGGYEHQLSGEPVPAHPRGRLAKISDVSTATTVLSLRDMPEDSAIATVSCHFKRKLNANNERSAPENARLFVPSLSGVASDDLIAPHVPTRLVGVFLASSNKSGGGGSLGKHPRSPQLPRDDAPEFKTVRFSSFKIFVALYARDARAGRMGKN